MKMKHKQSFFESLLYFIFTIGLIVIIVYGVKYLLLDIAKPADDGEFKSVYVEGHTFDKKFSLDEFVYQVKSSEEKVFIGCEGGEDIEGCNEYIDITSKKNHLHKIKFYNGDEEAIYKIFIENTNLGYDDLEKQILH